MEPSIGRSIREGFRTAQRSWPGIGFYAGGWIIVTIVLLIGVMITNPPRELFEEAPMAGQPAQPSPAPASGGGQAAATPTTDPNATERHAAVRRERIFNDWFRHAWPVVLACLVLWAAASIWFTGAQLGYVAQQVRTGASGWAAFWSSGTQRFAAVLGGWAVSLLALGVVLLVVGLSAWLMGFIPQSAPRWLGALLGLAFGACMVTALVWVLVRTAFWFIAIIADRVGPIAGLKASFASTRGRWWRVAGLGCLLALMSYAVWVPSAVLDVIGGALSAPLGIIVNLLGTVLGAVGSLYLGFVSSAASVRFYDDTKGASSP